jgi:uncharacterized protein (DUF1800 family)
VATTGVRPWLDQQLRPWDIDDRGTELKLLLLPTLGLGNAELKALFTDPEQVIRELRLAALMRAVNSRCQLREVLVDFWTNHFNIDIRDGDARWFKTTDDREVIRKHALGRFRDLLAASAASPAMLVYLDNAVSQKGTPNENYARELLELHTLGVDSYSEADVLAAARVLTGWTIDPSRHKFRFIGAWHDDGPATVAGWSTPGHAGPAGKADGDALLAHLARQPATARHLARKLAVRFVSDDPPAALVEAAAQAYLASDTGITPMLRVLLEPATLRANAGAKVRRPFEALANAMRTLGASVPLDGATGDRLHWLLDAAGQPLFGWPAPNGYPDIAGAWLGATSVLERWNMGTRLVNGWVQGVQVDLAKLVGKPVPTTAGGLVDRLADRVLLRPLDAATRAVALAYIQKGAGAAMDQAAVTSATPAIVGLLLSLPIGQIR